MTSPQPITTAAATTPPSLSPNSSNGSAPLDEELSALVEITEQASRHISQEGKGDGPICLGWITQDLFYRLTYGEFSPAWRLSWGLTPTMGVALREEENEGGGEEILGQVWFGGDPTPPHGRATGWLWSKVAEQLHRRPLSDHSYSQVDCARSTTTDIVYVRVNDSSEQEVPLLKEPDESYVDCSERIFTTIEVAWANEDVVHLLAVVNKWAEGDRNAIGVKLWRDSDARASILVLSQARRSTEVHVWRYGAKAQEALLSAPGRNIATIVERPGPAAVLPGEWFCRYPTSRSSPDDPPPPAILWSLSELALQMESYYRAQTELRIPLGSEAQRAMRKEKSGYFAQRLVAYVQAEVDDIRCAEGISEELRVRLLEEKEDELGVCKRRVARRAEREQEG